MRFPVAAPTLAAHAGHHRTRHVETLRALHTATDPDAIGRLIADAERHEDRIIEFGAAMDVLAPGVRRGAYAAT